MSEPESAPHDPAAIAVGQRVRQERDARGLTQAELGEAAGLDRRQIERVEAARHGVQLRNLLRIADAMQLTLSALVAGVEELMANPPETETPKRRGRKPRKASGDGGDPASRPG